MYMLILAFYDCIFSTQIKETKYKGLALCSFSPSHGLCRYVSVIVVCLSIDYARKTYPIDLEFCTHVEHSIINQIQR